MVNRRIVLAGVLCILSSSLLLAQTISKGKTVTATATIQAIDATNRQLTLRNEKGEEETYTVGPDVTRFDELKVGDVVKMTYYESVVMQLRKPGDATQGTSGDAAVTRAPGALPGGTIAAQERMTVTVKSVDMTVPSITVTTDDGRTVTRKVADKKNLAEVKPGDKIDITYTVAILTSVERGK